MPPLIGNPYNGYINPYYWVDDHPLVYGNNGSLDPGTNGGLMKMFYSSLNLEFFFIPSQSLCLPQVS